MTRPSTKIITLITTFLALVVGLLDGNLPQLRAEALAGGSYEDVVKASEGQRCAPLPATYVGPINPAFPFRYYCPTVLIYRAEDDHRRQTIWKEGPVLERL